MKCILDAWNAHEAELLRFVQPRVPNREQARDLVHDVFLKAMKLPDGLCGVMNRRAWLFHVTRNLLIDRYRLTKEQMPLDETVELVDAPGVETAPVDGLSECLPRVLLELSAEDREAITLCDIQGITQQSYAARAGLTLPSAKARVQRARKRLRARLIEACQVRFDEQGHVCCFVPRVSAST